MHDIDTKLIKKTRKKLVISGDSIELYIYEKPLFYNYPGNDTSSKETNKETDERRFSSIKRSRDRIRRLCNANAYNYGDLKPKFLTLTFKENITDLDQARYLFKLFNQKLQYRYPNTKYLGVAEIQKKRYEKYGHKVWHFHIIYFNLPFIYGIKGLFQQLWPHGFIKINAINHVNNVGAYVSKYLRKDLYEKELVGEKSFFVSRNLIQPSEHKNETDVNNYLNKYHCSVQYQCEYQSNTHGKIIYQVLKK